MSVNIVQNKFLEYIVSECHDRGNLIEMNIHLVNNVRLVGHIIGYDDDSIILNGRGKTQIVFKKAILTICPGDKGDVNMLKACLPDTLSEAALNRLVGNTSTYRHYTSSNLDKTSHQPYYGEPQTDLNPVKEPIDIIKQVEGKVGEGSCSGIGGEVNNQLIPSYDAILNYHKNKGNSVSEEDKVSDNAEESRAPTEREEFNKYLKEKYSSSDDKGRKELLEQLKLKNNIGACFSDPDDDMYYPSNMSNLLSEEEKITQEMHDNGTDSVAV